MDRPSEAERFVGKALGLVKLGSSKAFADRWGGVMYQVPRVLPAPPFLDQSFLVERFVVIDAGGWLFKRFHNLLWPGESSLSKESGQKSQSCNASSHDNETLGPMSWSHPGYDCLDNKPNDSSGQENASKVDQIPLDEIPIDGVAVVAIGEPENTPESKDYQV